MSTKHTTGPWTFTLDSFAPGAYSTIWCKKQYDDGGGIIATVIKVSETRNTTTPLPDHEASMANTRLIAAAPDLLAALERLDTVTTWGDSHFTGSKYYTFNEDDAVIIRAAIANTKGGEE